MKIYHKIENIKIENKVLSLVVDDHLVKMDLSDVSPLLSKASKAELDNFEVSPSGYGIHWPQLDEDISVDGLLGITHSPGKSKKSA